MQLPHSLEAEKAVLGAILRDPSAILTAVDQLVPESFFLEAHSQIFGVMCDLFKANESADILTVADRLRASGEKSEYFGASYLVELTESCPVAQNIEYYVGIVRRDYYRRRIVMQCQSVIQGALACEDDVEALIERVESEFLTLAQEHDRQGLVSADQVVEATIDDLQKSLERGDGISGIPTGFVELDGLIGGWQRSDLVILAARPGMGKTALALNTAAYAAKNGFTAAVFTLEMTKEQLMARMLSAESRVDSSRLRRGALSDEETDRLMEGARRVHVLKHHLAIDETSGVSILELRSRCRRFKMEHGLDLVVVDYLQLMSAGASARKQDSREREISEISMGLKTLAKELNVPVIALAQLNRSPEARQDRRPRLSDLRESGSLEHDADLVMFVYRDEYYNPSSEKVGIAELIVAKNRHGATTTLELAFQPNYVSFQNLVKSDGGFSPAER